MTEPWASAHVDVELDWDNLDEQLIRRLTRASEIAQRAASRNFDKLAANARRSFDKVGDHYDSAMKRMERRTMSGVASINRTLNRIQQNTVASVAVRMAGASAEDVRDMGEALRRLQRTQGNVRVQVDVTVNGLAEVRELDAALRRLPRSERVRVDVDVDRRSVGRLGLLGGSVGRLTSGLAGLGKKGLSAVATVGKFAGIAGSAVVAAGALVPVIGALGAGLASLGGAAGTVAAGGLFALVAAGGALATAFNGVGDAITNAFDPEKAEEFEKALAKLTPSAQSAVRAMQGLGKTYADVVKTPVQEAMFSGLAPKIARLQRFMIPLRDSLVDVAQGFNDGANGALRMIETARGTSMVNTLLSNAGSMASDFGAAITSLIPGFLSLGSAATSVLSPMTEGIGSIAHGWSETMMRMQETGELQAKMQGFLDTAKQIGAALGQLGGIISGVFSAAKAAGDGNPFGNIMGSLTQINEWVNGPGQQALTSFFSSVGQVASTLLPIFTQVAGIIGGQVAPMIAQLVTAIGPTLGVVVQQLGLAFAALQPAIAPLGEAMSAIGAALAPVLPIVGQLIAQFVQIAGPVLGSLVQALSPVLQSLGQGLVSALSALQPAVEPVGRVFAALSPVLTKIADVLAQVLVGAIQAIVPAIEAFAQGFSKILEALTPIIPILGEALMQIVTALAPLISTMADAWLRIVEALVPLIPPLVQIVGALLPPLVQLLTSLLPLLTVSSQVFSALVTAVAPVVAILLRVVAGFAQLLGTIISFVATALGAIAGFVSNVVGRFASMVATVVSTVSGWVSSVLGFFSNLVSRAVSFVTGLWSKVKNGFTTGVSTVIGVVKQLPGKVLDVFKTAGSWLVDMGKKIIEGLIRGIKAMAGKIKDAVTSIVPDSVKRFIPGLMVGGVIPGYARGGALPALAAGGAAGRVGSATTGIKPGGFVVNAAATKRNKKVLQAIAPRGRVLSGPGTGTSDSITGMHGGRPVAAVSRGEYYVPPEAARGLMPVLVAMNYGKSVGGINALAAGGAVSVDKLVDFAKGVEGQPYVWGGVHWGDCSGAVSALANFATGADPWASRFATGSEKEELAKRGFKPGLGPAGSLNVGWFNGGPYGGHTAATLPNGTNFEMGGARGDGQYGGQAAGADDPQFTDHAHLPPEFFGGLDAGAPTSGSLGGLATGGGGSTPIGSGLGSSGGGSASWGNSGGGSKANSASDAKRQGLTPVWVENWPATIGGGGSGSGLTTSDTGAGLTASTSSTSGGKDTIPLTQNADGTWSSTDPAWDHLIQRESGGKADIVQQVSDVNSGGNEASGLFQIAKSTWASNGGKKYAPTAGEASAEQQAEIAAKIFNEQGGSPWGAGLAGREDEDKLRAGIQKGGVPVTPDGNVPVEVDGGLDTGTTASTDDAATVATPQPAMEVTIGGGTLSSQAGGYAKTASATGLDAWIKDHPGLLGDYDNSKAQTSLGSRLGSVADTAVSGQLSSALGILGLDAQPPILDAIGQYMSDNKKEGGGDTATKKDLSDLFRDLVAAGFGKTEINNYGDADAAEVARKVDATRRRKARRYVK